MTRQVFSSEPYFYDYRDNFGCFLCCDRTYPEECHYKGEEGKTWETCDWGKESLDRLVYLVKLFNDTGRWEVF